MDSAARSIIFENGCVRILNQLLLPTQVVYENVPTVQHAWKAIYEMKVRGAPAIAMLGLLSLAGELSRPETINRFGAEPGKLRQYVHDQAQYLCSARPTAVNIRKEFDRLVELTDREVASNKDIDQVLETIKQHCLSVFEAEQKVNRDLAQFGAVHIAGASNANHKLNILTHCNTGSLATSGYGTALGVIRWLHQIGRLQRAYCTETRPYNQGARLTAWELVTDKVPGVLICDNMVAALMARNQIDAVVVGADRVAANGDTANKIGTYQLAILAKHFGVPFYVASPVSTLDLDQPDGGSIPIEERPWREMKFVGPFQIAPDDIECWNPAFDITPASLITGGIITERGVLAPEQIMQVFSGDTKQ